MESLFRLLLLRAFGPDQFFQVSGVERGEPGSSPSLLTAPDFK
jgi:hypothetical protein